MTMSKIPEDEIPSRLIEIRNQFLEKVKAGKFKYSFGFGGKGLEKLQQIRDSTRSLQKKEYGPNDDDDVNFVADKTNGTAKKDGATSLPALEVAVDLPDFQVIEGRAPETSGPDKSKFHSRITINDLPQRARWFVVNRDSLSTVSYTHLDVYKRQLLYRAAFPSRQIFAPGSPRNSRTVRYTRKSVLCKQHLWQDCRC